MTVTVKTNAALTVPLEVQRQAGIKAGDRVEFRVSGGIINIVPELPAAGEEYTPEQRRVIDARLAAARKGPYHGLFQTADQAITFLRKETKRRRTVKQKTT